MKELIERIECAEGPSRELDALIWCHLHGKKYQGHHQAWQSDETQVEYTEPPKRKSQVSQSRSPEGHAKPWTASLDAAMTLVPERATYVRMEICGRGKAGQHCLVSVQWEASGDECCFDGDGKTPALALAAAALKARTATAKDDR